MAGFDIGGTWEGEFSYDPCEAVPQKAPARFSLTARAGWFGFFKGVIQDDPEREAPQPATVRGRLKGLVLTFKKQYPIFFVRHAGRTIPLREWIESEHRLPVDQDLPGQRLLYEGEYDAAEESVSGTWRHGPQRIRFLSNGRMGWVDFPAASGRWKMRRQSPTFR